MEQWEFIQARERDAAIRLGELAVYLVKFEAVDVIYKYARRAAHHARIAIALEAAFLYGRCTFGGKGVKWEDQGDRV